MTTTPTPEQFLAQTEPDEDELEEGNTADPLESIAASLRQIAGSYAQVELAETEDAQLQTRVRDLEAELTELEALADAKQALLDEVLTICKPSTSKLANAIRAAIEPVVAPPSFELVHYANCEGGDLCECAEVAEIENQPAAVLTAPAHDADVAEWRGYARQLGHGRTGPAFNDLEQMNRSQIRTLLGVPHVAVEA